MPNVSKRAPRSGIEQTLPGARTTPITNAFAFLARVSVHRSATVFRQLRSLRTDECGAAMPEYTVLIGTVALVCSGAFITVGVALVNSFEDVRSLILYPFP